MAKKVSLKRSDLVLVIDEINEILGLDEDSQLAVEDADKIADITNLIKEAADQMYTNDPWSKGTLSTLEALGIKLQEPPAEEKPEEEEKPNGKKGTKKSSTKGTKAPDPGPEEEEEEDPEEELEEEDEPEGDGLDELDRVELKKVNTSEGLGITVMKTMSDDDLRSKIREARTPKPAAKPVKKEKRADKPKSERKGGFEKKSYSRPGCVAEVVSSMKLNTSLSIKELISKADKKYSEYGGTSNEKEMKANTDKALKVLITYGILELKNDSIKKIL